MEDSDVLCALHSHQVFVLVILIIIIILIFRAFIPTSILASLSRHLEAEEEHWKCVEEAIQHSCPKLVSSELFVVMVEVMADFQKVRQKTILNNKQKLAIRELKPRHHFTYHHFTITSFVSLFIYVLWPGLSIYPLNSPNIP